MKKTIALLPFALTALLLSACGKCTKHSYHPVTVEGANASYFVCDNCGNVWDPNNVLTSSSSSESSISSISENPDSYKPNYSILFIGNSFTFRNDLPKTFQDYVASQGFTVTVDSVTASSYYLINYNKPEDAQGAIVHQKLEQNKYDYVFLQEQSRAPIDNKKDFYNGVRGLVEKIRARGATPILYETWGFDEGHSTTAAYGGFDAMSRKIAAAYEAIGEELDVTVSKVGMAFHTIHTAHPEIDLYHSDYFHPSVYGTYLAMMTHYATIYHKTVRNTGYVENRYETKELPAPTSEQLSLLQEAAYQAAFSGETIVTPEYKVSSTSVK